MPRRGSLRRFPTPLRRIASGSLVLLLLAAGCTAGPSTRPAVLQHHDTAPAQQRERQHPTTQGPVPLPPLDEATSSALNWEDCTEQTRRRLGERGVPSGMRFSCASVITTAGTSSLPTSGVLRIHLLKVGNGPVPLLVLNDISGAPGSLYAARLAARLPPALLETFSLIGVDRRGTGLSNPIACIPTQVRLNLLNHDPASEGANELLDAARSAGQQCAIELEERRRSYDSWHTAKDLELIRRALGVEHLNAIARGEGSSVLIAYAKRFPERVGRFVLNGIPDPSPNLLTVFGAVAQATNEALRQFDQDCAADCPIEGDARQAVTALVEQLRRDPARTSAGYPFGPALALRAVRRGLAHPQRWPELAAAIASARSGEVDRLAEFISPLLRGTAKHPPRIDATIATVCNDTATRVPATRIDKILAKLQQKHPLFAGLAAQRLAWCSPWPPPNKTVSLPSVTNVPPILVISSAADPLTPGQGTARAASQLPTAVRIAWQGTGHATLRSSCVTEAVQHFLVKGKVPQQGTLCPA